MAYKGYQREDKEDRAQAYRDWRHTFGNHLYVSDLDQVEYRIINGEIVPVALIELTRVDDPVRLPKVLQDRVLQRFDVQYASGKFLRTMAGLLDLPAYLVLFVADLSEFHVYSYQASMWKVMGSDEYKIWIQSL